MKSTFVTLVISLLAYNGFAQQNFLLTSGSSFDNFSNKTAIKKEKENRIKNNIASQQSTSLNSKGEPVIISETIYNKKGNWTEKNLNNKKGELKHKWTGLSNDNGNYLETKRENVKGKISFYSKREFDKNNNMTSFTFMKNGTKINSQGHFKYENDLCVEAIYSGGDITKSRKYVYSYYEDGKNKETILYNKKGKEKHRWSYSCDPKGQEVAKKETEVCEKTEIDENGNKTVVYLYDDEKQKVRKVVIIFDKSDNRISSTRYRKSGNIYNKEISSFDKANNQLSYKYYQREEGKPIMNYKYEYDQNNNRVKTQRLKRDDKLKKSYSYQYKTF